MKTFDRRQHPRLRVNFPTSLSSVGLTHPIEAVTENVSQVGAYIRTKDWSVFEPKERVLATFFLPTSFTGQEKTTALQGASLITRVEPEKEGVSLQFVQTVRQFE